MTRQGKKIAIILGVIIAVTLSAGLDYSPKQRIKTAAHEIAETARESGLAETDAIIQSASNIWWEAHERESYTQEDLRILATVIYYEAPNCTDRHQQLVAQVILNRVGDPRFPDTVRGVVEQPGQYASWYTSALPEIPERYYDNARAALEGRVECPSNVIYQSQYAGLGTGVYESIYVNTGWYASTTYFCYG
jgi:hypothetical protein